MRQIDADVLLEKFAGLEATALDMCKRHMYDDDLTLWKRWSVILAERTAYKYDVVDAPTVDAEPCWIPCSERLPEDGVYLVYAPDYQGGSSSSKEFHDGVMFAKRKNGKWSIEHGYYSRPNCVKAWMPLPKPYEVEKDDRKAAIDEEIEKAWEYAETD